MCMLRSFHCCLVCLDCCHRKRCHYIYCSTRMSSIFTEYNTYVKHAMCRCHPRFLICIWIRNTTHIKCFSKRNFFSANACVCSIRCRHHNSPHKEKRKSNLPKNAHEMKNSVIIVRFHIFFGSSQTHLTTLYQLRIHISVAYLYCEIWLLSKLFI